MTKPSRYTDIMKVRLPDGAFDRIDRVSGIDPADRKSGTDVRGPILRKWIMERLVAEESAADVGLVSAPPPDPAETDDWLERAATLLKDPITRERFQRRILMSEDDRHRKALALV
ncbi:hypothetical protein [Azospirillum sp. sgz302134]